MPIGMKRIQNKGMTNTTQSHGGGLEADKTTMGNPGPTDVESELIDLESSQKLLV